MRLEEWVLNHHIAVRFGAFFFFLGVLAIFERLRPRRSLHYNKTIRWFSNLGIGFIDIAILRIIFPLLAVDMAFLIEEKQWGLFHLCSFSSVFNSIIGFLILDFSIYAQHVAFHYIPLFWRFHRMHHADLDVDVSTGQRFHPFEIILSMGIKIGLVVIFGINPFAVILFEIVLNASSLFTHTNWKLPFDRALRWIIVTPDMHRIHHSVFPVETNSNFGFSLSIWDRLFRTYRKKPKDGHESMDIGLNAFKNKKYLYLKWMLYIPFIKKER